MVSKRTMQRRKKALREADRKRNSHRGKTAARTRLENERRDGERALELQQLEVKARQLGVQAQQLGVQSQWLGNEAKRLENQQQRFDLAKKWLEGSDTNFRHHLTDRQTAAQLVNVDGQRDPVSVPTSVGIPSDDATATDHSSVSVYSNRPDHYQHQVPRVGVRGSYDNGTAYQCTSDRQRAAWTMPPPPPAARGFHGHRDDASSPRHAASVAARGFPGHRDDASSPRDAASASALARRFHEHRDHEHRDDASSWWYAPPPQQHHWHPDGASSRRHQSPLPPPWHDRQDGQFYSNPQPPPPAAAAAPPRVQRHDNRKPPPPRTSAALPAKRKAEGIGQLKNDAEYDNDAGYDEEGTAPPQSKRARTDAAAGGDATRSASKPPLTLAAIDRSKVKDANFYDLSGVFVCDHVVERLEERCGLEGRDEAIQMMAKGRIEENPSPKYEGKMIVRSDANNVQHQFPLSPDTGESPCEVETYMARSPYHTW